MFAAAATVNRDPAPAPPFPFPPSFSSSLRFLPPRLWRVRVQCGAGVAWHADSRAPCNQTAPVPQANAAGTQAQNGQTLYDTASNVKVVENESFDERGNDTSTA